MGRRALLAMIIASMGMGCAAITGLDQYVRDDCAGGGCDGSIPDGGARDGTSDTSSDVMPAKDGATDSGSNTDAADTGTTTDAEQDANCGPVNTIQNCGSCGAACDTLTSSNQSCIAATCAYSCNSGRSDCDNATAPNLDGCECNTPACCGSGCQITHNDGYGQSFYDCTALNTHDQTQATEACAAYTSNQAACASFGCTGPGSNQVVCGTSGGICICWNYSGSNVGHVYSSGSATCNCPTSTSPTWD